MKTIQRIMAVLFSCALGCGAALAQTTQAWGVNAAGQIWQWSGAGPWKSIPGGLSNISVASDGSVWGVNSTSNIFRRVGDQWQGVPGGLVQVSAGQANNVWGVNAADDIWRWDGGNWVQVAGKLIQVSASADGNVWGVDRSGKIYRRSGESWQLVPGGLVQVSVGRADQVWGVNAVDDIWRWTGATWTQVAGKLANVAVAADGSVWGVGRNGTIFRRDGEKWTVVPGGLKQVSLATVASATDPGSLVININPVPNIPAPTTYIPISINAVPNIPAPTSNTIVLQGAVIVEPAPAPIPTPTPAPALVISSGPVALPYRIGATGTSSATCGVQGKALCSPVPTNFAQNASIECPAGSFLDVGKWSCWTCPAGYVRSLAAVDTERACQKADPNQTRAMFSASFKEPWCPVGTFHDPIRGGECYTCPAGYTRSAAHVDAPNACYVAAGESFARPIRHRTTIWPHDCTSGQFWDGWNGGGCWTCPSGFVRSGHPIDNDRACSKAVAEQQAKAAVHSKAECGPGEIKDLKIAGVQDFARGGGCWTCPTATERTIHAVDGSQACERPAGFVYASATQSKALTCEITEIFDPINSNNAAVTTALNERNRLFPNSPISAASSGGTCWTCPPGTKRNTNTVYGGSACQPTGIFWDSTSYNQPGLFHLDGAEAVALKLASERTLINEIIAGMKAGDTTGKLPANFAKLVWEDIGVRPQDSAVLKVAVFARVVAAANQPSAATADERLLLASVVEQIRQFRIFMAQDALNAYKSWAANEDYRKTVYASSVVAQSVDMGEIPPDFEDITAETILGSMAASGGSSSAIALALAPQAMRAKIFPYAFRATYQGTKSGVTAARVAATTTRLTRIMATTTGKVAAAGAKAAAGISMIAASIGPQVIVTIAIEVLSVVVEQQIDRLNAEPKLLTGLANATNTRTDFARLMSTQSGVLQAEGYWTNLMSGPAERADGSQPDAMAPRDLPSFAQLALAAQVGL